MNLVVLDGYSVNPGDLSWDAMRQLGDLVVYDRTTASQVEERVKDAQVVLTNKVVITGDLMDSLPKLEYIGVLSTGYNVVDIQAAAHRGIVVANVPAYSTDSVVQMTFAHILNITNRVAYYAEANRKGRWSSSPDFCYWDEPVNELAGRKLGIVGLGNIGMKVARLALCFGMEVLAYTSKEQSALADGIHKASLAELFANSDIITLHCPLTPSTRALVNADMLGLCKQGAILVNTGRGQLVDEQAVADALASGRLSAYGADVSVQEPPAVGNPLLSAPNAYLTPHIAWATVQARRRLISIAAANVKAFIDGKPVNVVSL